LVRSAGHIVSSKIRPKEAGDEHEGRSLGKLELEIVLCVLVGLPWYAFAKHAAFAIAIHAMLIVAFLGMELLLFSRGSAVMSFLLVLFLSILAGVIAIGINGGRLGP